MQACMHVPRTMCKYAYITLGYVCMCARVRACVRARASVGMCVCLRASIQHACACACARACMFKNHAKPPSLYPRTHTLRCTHVRTSSHRICYLLWIRSKIPALQHSRICLIVSRHRGGAALFRYLAISDATNIKSE